ncbi:MAG: DivIVA domain-containing protein [Oscillospiraceae bacterium]|jgi:cell division initiation protein|nr:DivIVA domain-containing protein [Oscillospiraceae bacterium]
MLTLNEIRNVNFRKSNFGGYRAEDVEAFIDEVQLSYDALLRENAELVKKLEVLASRLSEYQNEEDSIRNALMNAQKVGDASLRDAKHKAEIILKDATIKAERIVSNAQSEIHRERDIIERMQRDIAEFKARLLRAYKDHLTLINTLPTGEILTPETKSMSDSVVMLDRRAAAPFSPPNEQPRRQQEQPAPQERPVPPRRPVQEEYRDNAPAPIQQEIPVFTAEEPKQPQRKGGFTVDVEGANDMAPAAAPARPQPRAPRVPPKFDTDMDIPMEGLNIAGAKINENQLADVSETSPTSLFNRRRGNN